MDTVEELGKTYYYNDMMNLPANELFYWIMLDATVGHFTSAAVAADVMAAAAIYSGQNNMPVSGKLANATPGHLKSILISQTAFARISLTSSSTNSYWQHHKASQNQNYHDRQVRYFRWQEYTCCWMGDTRY
jgi:hypothetical protein